MSSAADLKLTLASSSAKDGKPLPIPRDPELPRRPVSAHAGPLAVTGFVKIKDLVIICRPAPRCATGVDACCSVFKVRATRFGRTAPGRFPSHGPRSIPASLAPCNCSAHQLARRRGDAPLRTRRGKVAHRIDACPTIRCRRRSTAARCGISVGSGPEARAARRNQPMRMRANRRLPARTTRPSSASAATSNSSTRLPSTLTPP